MKFIPNLARQFEGLSGLPVGRQLSLLLLIAVTLAMLGVTVLWSRSPTFQTLQAPASDREAAALVQALSKANIPYRIEPGSRAVQVPARQLSEARLQLAAQGVTTGGSRGFEMMAEQGFGTSQFLEQARYYKAIEGELERSISALTGVASARVHLAIPKQSAFVRQR